MEKQIKISDLGLASLLMTLKYELLNLEGSGRVYFSFKKDVGIEEVISNYWKDTEMKVRIQSLFNNQRVLKNRIFAKR